MQENRYIHENAIKVIKYIFKKKVILIFWPKERERVRERSLGACTSLDTFEKKLIFK